MTDITGTYNGSAITPPVLPPGTCCELPSNDNLVYIPPPFLDNAGIGFSTASLPEVNLTFTTFGLGSYVAFNGPDDLEGSIGGTFTLTPIPEPSTWAMMAIGFGLLGGAGYWRRRSARLTPA
jgi:hypothetical protein